MSLILFDGSMHPERRYSLWPTPGLFGGPTSSIVSSMLNEGFRNLQQLERELGNLTDDVDGKGLVFRCNVAGYRPDELKVDVEGNELMIAGEHKDKSKGQSVHRTFIRRVTIPDSIVRESIKCDIDEKGCLEVTGESCEAPAAKKQKIPIGFKRTGEEVKVKTTKDASSDAKRK